MSRRAWGVGELFNTINWVSGCIQVSSLIYNKNVLDLGEPPLVQYVLLRQHSTVHPKPERDDLTLVAIFESSPLQHCSSAAQRLWARWQAAPNSMIQGRTGVRILAVPFS